MFIAHDENNQRYSVANATRENRYFCPICGETLIIRAENSLAVRKHFAHKRGTVCVDDWSHDMSEWHLSWQEKFPEECREVVVEKDGVKHRADVLINNTIIEFQHSPITSEEITKRNTFYLSCGYQVVWIFDAEGQIKNSIEDTIDPMKCGDNDLCWKRAKTQFVKPFPPKVSVFLDYSTEVSVPHYINQKVRILLWLKNVMPKEISYYKMRSNSKYYYITPANFLKQYGAISDPKVLSISEIINQIKQPQRALKYYIRPQSYGRVLVYSVFPLYSARPLRFPRKRSPRR